MSEQDTPAVEPGVYAKIRIDELTVADAYQAVEDPSFWDETMPPVLYHYRLSLEDYERLTVYQHRLLCEWLAEKGVIGAL